MKTNEIKALAKKYGITLIYLFGSQAGKGVRYLQGECDSLDDLSDLDVAVAFEHVPVEAMKTYGVLFREISEIFSPFTIDLVFMHEVDTLFQYEIVKGVRVYEKDEDYADSYEEGIMKMAEDLLFKKRILNHEIIEAIEDGYFEFEYSPNS